MSERYAASLSPIPCSTCSMPSSSARAATPLEVRPERIAACTPLCRSIWRPRPSTEWKPFSSSIPRAPYQRVPSVSTPSTSRIMRRMRRARSSASEAGGMPASDDFGAEQVVHVERADQPVALVDHQQLVDLVPLHELHGLDRQSFRANGFGSGRHEAVDGGGMEVGAFLQRAAQIAVGEDAAHAAG